MEHNEYRHLCERPDAFSRHELTLTLRVLDQAHNPAADRIREILERMPIKKPTKHAGGNDTDHFLVSLGSEEANNILDCVRDGEVDALGEGYSATGLASAYASLADKWFRYVESQ